MKWRPPSGSAGPAPNYHAPGECGGGIASDAQVSLTSDNVFCDEGRAHELGTLTGSVEGGLTVGLTQRCAAVRAG